MLPSDRPKINEMMYKNVNKITRKTLSLRTWGQWSTHSGLYAMKLSDSCEVLRNYMSDLSRSVGRCTNMEKVLSMELDYTEILPNYERTTRTRIGQYRVKSYWGF
jgi:hypothetical protein